MTLGCEWSLESELVSNPPGRARAYGTERGRLAALLGNLRMSWERALGEIAYVAGEMHAVREAGFMEGALRFPRSRDGLVALCAFNGIKPEQAPPGWRYWPNAAMKSA